MLSQGKPIFGTDARHAVTRDCFSFDVDNTLLLMMRDRRSAEAPGVSYRPERAKRYWDELSAEV